MIFLPAEEEYQPPRRNFMSMSLQLYIWIVVNHLLRFSEFSTEFEEEEEITSGRSLVEYFLLFCDNCLADSRKKKVKKKGGVSAVFYVGFRAVLIYYFCAVCNHFHYTFCQRQAWLTNNTVDFSTYFIMFAVGLEWPLVFTVTCVNGVIPTPSSDPS
jgi:hypothetical protein